MFGHPIANFCHLIQAKLHEVLVPSSTDTQSTEEVQQLCLMDSANPTHQTVNPCPLSTFQPLLMEDVATRRV